MSYKELGLKCGIEIHQQLQGRKLFSSAPTLIRDDEPDFQVVRELRAAAGEGGAIDVAAQAEHAKKRKFIYQGYTDTTSLVELDEEPPHAIDQLALHASLQVSKLVNARVSNVVQVMRKTVIDGSNTSGFQRTALVARGGSISTSQGDVRIANISIEEDSCRIISAKHDEKVYRLDRLGIPLIEIGTQPDITSPEQCQEAAREIGMILRSLPNVKRGLGTIRQDVNVSISGGERVEIKGAQDLKAVPQLVELEIKRQVELLKIKEALQGKELGSFHPLDLSSLFVNSHAKKVQHAIKNGLIILGIRLTWCAGLLGKELQPNLRVGSELSGYAKVAAGVGGIFHSDELPAYGISQEEVNAVKDKLQVGERDAFVMVTAPLEQAESALIAVYNRAKQLTIGVPKEVRKANADATTSFMRPMPGAARMYPETDVPLIFPDLKSVELPELYTQKIKRFQDQYSLSKDLASFVCKSEFVDLFEESVKSHPKIKAAFIADTLTSMLVEIRRKYSLDTSSLTQDHFRQLFKALSEDKIHKDIVMDVLIDMIKGKFDLEKYKSLSTEEIHQAIVLVLKENPTAPFGALMGKCMKHLEGKASGEVIARELKRISAQGHK